MKTVHMDKDELVRSAKAEWLKSGGMAQPSSNSSGVMEHDGKMYVVLVNVNGPFAVYRIRKDGSLKRLEKRWPVQFYRLGMYE